MFGKILSPFIMIFLIADLAHAQVDTLSAMRVDNPPVIDGVVDALWDGATAVTINLGETYDVHDPASIMDCTGCHNFDSAVTVDLKAVYTTDHFYLLATWPDPTASFTRGGSWSFANDSWEKPNSDQSEDRVALLWPMGTITGNPYDTCGCMANCHNYWPTDTDHHVSEHGIVDDAWFESGRADIWHSKAARCAGYLSASGTDLVIDPVTHEVTGGTFSMLGFADDKYVDVWAPDSINGEDGGRYGDQGTSTYSHNRIGDHSRPKYMETAPVDFADAMILTQDEIDGSECVGDATLGVSDADAATYWPAYEALYAVVPERILRQPDGSRGDLDFGSVWSNGTWTAELGRELQNGNADDVQFDTQNDYLFGVAAFENSRHGYEHRTSDMYLLTFATGVGVGEQTPDIPHSYALAQNYPNPFNPSTTIVFEIADVPGRSLDGNAVAGQRVNLTVFDVRGRSVRTLVDRDLMPGNYRIQWDGRDDGGQQVTSGIYLYTLRSGERTITRKMVALK